jgi:SAM-dependent methyltransferase
LRCILCHAEQIRIFAEIHLRRYFECDRCALVFLAPEQRPSPEAERAHYGTHENDPADSRYRAFLSRLVSRLAERLPEGADGLDYGCGPGPALQAMFDEMGFDVAIYDPFFAPDRGVLDRSYDFITCTETAEHFFTPGEEFDRLDRLLRPGGWLGIMTEMLDESRRFEEWRYVRDPTHVCFYRPDTMRWIASRHDWNLESPRRDVVLFRKPDAGRRQHDAD